MNKNRKQNLKIPKFIKYIYFSFKVILSFQNLYWYKKSVYSLKSLKKKLKSLKNIIFQFFFTIKHVIHNQLIKYVQM